MGVLSWSDLFSYPPPTKYIVARELRHLFYHIRTQVEARWGSSALHADLKYQAISAFLFLRFFIPALLRPEQYGLTVDPPPDGVDRSLKSLARALQSLANLNTVSGCIPELQFD
jgi:hypothetical protein